MSPVSATPPASRTGIERVSPDDLMSLVSERGSVPLQIGAVLVLDPDAGVDPVRVVEALGRRVTAIPRLRQRLVSLPWAGGRPIWVDDGEFAIGNHVTDVTVSDGEEGALRVAAETLGARLPRDRPLWSATVVTDAAGRGSAVVVVLHHVLADGVGGLALLAGLADGAGGAPDPDFPRMGPSLARLVRDSAADRLRGVTRLPGTVRRLRSAVGELQLSKRARATRSSLNQPTGRRRRLSSVTVDLDGVAAAAHAHQATVNDVVLSAIAAALHRLLASRGERVDEFMISVPFSARRATTAGDLGNQSGAILLPVSGVGKPKEALQTLAIASRAAKRQTPGASNALLGPLFRMPARVGLYQRFIDSQQLIHTFVSNLRGPPEHLSFLGCPVTNIIPLSLAPGNITVSFVALSYAGHLAITVVADPDACPDLTALRDALVEEIGVLTAVTSGP